jgi:hypothetical protein
MFYHSITWCHNPEDHNLNLCHCKNLSSHNSEMLSYCNTTWCHNPEDHNLNLHCCENLEPHNSKILVSFHSTICHHNWKDLDLNLYYHENVKLHNFTQSHNPEDHNLNLHCCEKLQSSQPRDVGILPHHYTVSQPRRPHLECSLTWNLKSCRIWFIAILCIQ